MDMRSQVMIALLAAISSTAMIDAVAQDVPQQAPQPMAYPQAQMQQPPTAPRPNPLRQLFAGTVSAVLQGVGSGVAVGLTQGVTGSVASWFDRRQRKSAEFGQPAYVPQPSPAYGTQPTYGTQPSPTYGTQSTYGTQPSPTYGTQSAYPTTPQSTTTDPYGTTAPATGGYPTAPATGAYPSAPGTSVGAPVQNYDWSTTQVYDPRTGQMTSAQAGGYAVASPPPDATQIVAGGAYDVHAVGAAGNETYVNAATYEFRTGDQFKVYFRPTLPGRLEVYNINPSGRETRIDSVDVAAGQLTTLGPYQFTATKGDESLRFVIAPCTTQQLFVATRDIVNVYASAPPSYGTPAPTSGGLPLSACGAPTTRSVDAVKTRDIQKVAVDGTTSFALDPVSQAELASGQFAPRQFTVWFHHR
jgi:hypothetical protein